MSSFLDLIFGFDSGTFGGADSGLGFSVRVSGWVVIAAIGMLCAFAWLSYRNLTGRPAIRFTLGCVRWGVLTLLLVLILGPQIERNRTLIEPDRVIVMLDVSGSMNSPEAGPDGTTTTRAQIVETMLDQNAETFEQFNRDSILDIYTFSDREMSYEFPRTDPLSVQETGSTNLHSSMQAALSNAGTHPVSGVVLVSDGQSQDEPSTALIELLLGSNIPVMSVPIGSPDPIRDTSVRTADHPSAAYLKDRVPFLVRGSAQGHQTGEQISIQLIDKVTGIEVSSASTILDADGEWEASLSHVFSDPGTRDFLVQVSTEKRSDLVTTNDKLSLSVQIVDEPMRVLYIDGYPRWEYRYLKNLLLREETIQTTAILLSADRRFIEEGQKIGPSIPNTFEEWEPVDVVILGDIRPELFSDSQLESLIRHIELRGCGLLWIAGEGYTPDAWVDSELGPLLPMKRAMSDSVSNTITAASPVVMSLTQDAQRVGVLANDTPNTPAVSNPESGWTVLRWNRSIENEALKPGVTTLAHAAPIKGGPENPLVTIMRYGGGRVGYVGTDEIWRYRYGRGGELPARFWLPLIRTIGRGTIARRASPAALTITPNRATIGHDIRMTLDVFDIAAIESLPGRIAGTIKPLSSIQPNQTIELVGKGDRRSTIWTPNEPGVYEIQVKHPLIGTDPITRSFTVRSYWDESSNPNTNHPALIDLSNQTNGAVLSIDQFNQLPHLLPNRTRITTLPPQTTPLWDRPIVLIVLMVFLSFEWIGRRLLRLA